MAEHLKGMNVRHALGDYSSSMIYEGRVVGWCEEGDLVLEKLEPKSVPPAPPGPPPTPDQKWVILLPLRRGTYLSRVSLVAIHPEPYPLKKPVIDHFPHTCTKCVHPALILFNMIECSWWGCTSYYQR